MSRRYTRSWPCQFYDRETSIFTRWIVVNKHEGYFRVLKVTFVWYGNYFLFGSFESIAGFHFRSLRDSFYTCRRSAFRRSIVDWQLRLSRRPESGRSSRIRCVESRPIDVVNPRNKVVDVERYFLDGSTFPTQPRIIEENRPHRENARVMRVLDLHEYTCRWELARIRECHSWTG